MNLDQKAVCPEGYHLDNNQCVQANPPTCPVEVVETPYGCLEKGPCPEGFGFYNNMCVASKILINQHGYVNPYTQYNYGQYPYGYNYGNYGQYPYGYFPYGYPR